MELQPNMYVRTKKGKIYKFETNNSMAKNGAKKYMVNCSHNIIDLIEVGDYVNGSEVTSKDQFLGFGNHDWYILDNEIKSIVTKEQFESMSYEVK